MNAQGSGARPLAKGAFNTGRLYTAQGQRIWWVQYDDGWLWFSDIDRMISGWIERTGPLGVLSAPVMPEWLMRYYDNNRYTLQRAGIRPPSMAADTEFGPALRI